MNKRHRQRTLDDKERNKRGGLPTLRFLSRLYQRDRLAKWMVQMRIKQLARVREFLHRWWREGTTTSTGDFAKQMF